MNALAVSVSPSLKFTFEAEMAIDRRADGRGENEPAL